MATCTPGPWIAEGTLVYAKGGIQPHICDTQDMAQDANANARLIAAAPELLVALKCLIREASDRKLNVRKDFHLLNALACANKTIHLLELESD